MIELLGVGARRGAELFADLSLTVGGGDAVVVAGAMGSGKSTLLRLIAGDLRCDTGSVSLFGRDLSRLRSRSRARLRRRVGFVPQIPFLLDDESALANLLLAVEAAGAPRRERLPRALATLDYVGLGSEAKLAASRLSSGRRRLLGLALALSIDPDILLVDEASAELDAAAMRRVFSLLEERRRAGLAVVAAASEARFVERAERAGWRHLAFEGGRLVDQGKFEDDSADADNVVAFPVAGNRAAGASE